MTPPGFDAVAEIRRRFDEAGCEGALHARRLPDGPAVEVDADRVMVLASVFKVAVALEFYSRVATGRIDPTEVVTTTPASRTLRPAGMSNFRDAATVSLRDLAFLVLTISDNAATDEILRVVGVDAVNARLAACGCDRTAIVGDLATMLDEVADDLGFSSYQELLSAQRGELGDAAKARGTDHPRIDQCRALDVAHATRSTPRDMTTLLAAIWADTAGPRDACQRLREVMGQHLGGRFGRVAPDDVNVAAKGGALFGRIRNEIGVLRYTDAKPTRSRSSRARTDRSPTTLGSTPRSVTRCSSPSTPSGDESKRTDVPFGARR